MVAATGWEPAAAAGASRIRNPAREKKEEDAEGAAGLRQAAMVGEATEEEVSGFPACGWDPEEMAERCLAEMQDAGEVERSRVESEGEGRCSEAVDESDGDEIAAPAGG